MIGFVDLCVAILLVYLTIKGVIENKFIRIAVLLFITPNVFSFVWVLLDDGLLARRVYCIVC